MQDWMFKQLSEEAAAEFREWAHNNYTVGDPINPVWHPVVRAECMAMNTEEAEAKRREFTVTFKVGVTAESPQQAAQFALDDLRDTSLLGPWVAEVNTALNSWTVPVESAGEAS
jgi:hypothetical protein